MKEMHRISKSEQDLLKAIEKATECLLSTHHYLKAKIKSEELDESYKKFEPEYVLKIAKKCVKIAIKKLIVTKEEQKTGYIKKKEKN